MAIEFQPLRDRILIERVAAESRIGNIVVPDTAKPKPQEAVVRAVGAGRLTKYGTRLAPDVKPGDRVLIGKYAGSEDRTLNDRRLLIVKEDEILAVIEQ